VLVSVYRPYEPLHAAKVPPVAVFTNEKGQILRQMTLVAADGSDIDAEGQVTGAATTLQYAIVGVNMAVSTRLVVSVVEESRTVLYYYYIRDLGLEIANHRDDPVSRLKPAGVSGRCVGVGNSVRVCTTSVCACVCARACGHSTCLSLVP
jgi:hypothetical protein